MAFSDRWLRLCLVYFDVHDVVLEITACRRDPVSNPNMLRNDGNTRRYEFDCAKVSFVFMRRHLKNKIGAIRSILKSSLFNSWRR